tara:strand:+ start:742 stop:1176 length:435 start_codon:yes stop_codon:yes gene_type:complete
MKTNHQISKVNFRNPTTSISHIWIRFMLLPLSVIIFDPIQLAKSDEVNLKCTGRFEINRGELIKPDWEISYFKINLSGIKSTIEDSGIKKQGRTLIRGDIYTITYRDNNKIKTKYKIDSTYGTYIVEYTKNNRTLIGTCQKSRG